MFSIYIAWIDSVEKHEVETAALHALPPLSGVMIQQTETARYVKGSILLARNS